MTLVTAVVKSKTTVSASTNSVQVGGDVRVVNSNGSFDNTYEPDDSPVTLPNIDFTDSDGTTSSVPSNENITATPSAGGGTLAITVYSDAGHTTSITEIAAGSTVYVKGVASGITATTYYLYIDNGTNAVLPASNGTGEFTYVVSLTGTIDIAIIAVDATNGVADSEPFELTVLGIFPPDIPGCVLWVDAALADTYTLNGADISELDDLSGEVNDLSAPATSNEPLFLDLGDGINSSRSSRFVNGQYMLASGLSLDTVSGSSVYLVVRFNSYANRSLMSNGNTITDGGPYMILAMTGTGVRTYQNGASYSSTYPVDLNKNYIFEIHRTSSSETFLINGVEKHTRSISVTGSKNNTYINQGFGGGTSADWGDIDIHNGILSSANKVVIRDYLIVKWDI